MFRSNGANLDRSKRLVAHCAEIRCVKLHVWAPIGERAVANGHKIPATRSTKHRLPMMKAPEIRPVAQANGGETVSAAVAPFHLSTYSRATAILGARVCDTTIARWPLPTPMRCSRPSPRIETGRRPSGVSLWRSTEARSRNHLSLQPVGPCLALPAHKRSFARRVRKLPPATGNRADSERLALTSCSTVCDPFPAFRKSFSTESVA